MALQIRRGVEADRLSITPLQGEPLWVTDRNRMYMGDGATAGGIPVGAVLPVDLVADGELVIGVDDTLLYVYETETLYKYVALGAAYTRDGLYVLNTLTGGATRWIAMAGKYAILDKGIRGTNTEALLGADIVTNGDFTTGDFTGWTAGANWSAATNAAVHTPGSTATLETNGAAVVASTWYRVTFTISGRTAGGLQFSLGGTDFESPAGSMDVNANAFSVGIYTTNTNQFIITPTNDFDGQIDNITIEPATISTPVLSLSHQDTTPQIEARTGGTGNASTFLGLNSGVMNDAARNVGIGDNALTGVTTSTDNIAIGANAVKRVSNITTSQGNIGVGSNTLAKLGSGSHNVAIGTDSLENLFAGSYNIGLGTEALNGTLSGINNVAIGYRAGYSNVSGQRNVFLGYQAGYWETGDDKLYIHNSNALTPLIYGDFSTRDVKINGEIETEAESFEVYNNTGGVLNQYTIVYVSGVQAVTGQAEVSAISSYYGQRPAGIMETALANVTQGKMFTKGIVQITGLDTTLATIGDTVYSDNTGVLTLTKTELPVGTVLNLNVNGRIFFDFPSIDLPNIRIFPDVASAEAASGSDNDLCFVASNLTFYKYEDVAGGIVDDDMVALSTADGGNTRWMAISGQYGIYDKYKMVISVANAGALQNVNQNDILYVSDTNTLYRYEAVGAAYTVNGTSILATVNGGNTRWLGLTGQYRIGDIHHQGTNTEAAIGAESLTNGDFASLDFTGWTAGAGWDASSGSAVCTGPGAGTLVQAPAGLTATSWYNVEFDISAYTTGTLTVTMGGQTVATLDGQIVGYGILIQASSTADLTFTPDATFDGTIDNVSVREVTFSTPVRTVYQDDGSIAYEERTGGFNRYGVFLGSGAGRASDASSNMGFGYQALASMSAGTGNCAFGSAALSKLSHRNATSNIAFGTVAFQNLQAGSGNVCIGGNTFKNKVGGSYNLGLGNNAGYENKYGSYNTFIGSGAGYMNDGSNNICIGTNAGYWSAGQSNRLYIDISGTTSPLIGGHFVDRWVKVDGKFFAKSVNLTVYNNTGGQLDQFRVLVTSGYYGAGQEPEADYLSSLTQRPLGVAVNNIADTTEGDVLRTGTIYVTGFSTLAATVGDKVYSDSAGNLTLTPSSIEVGIVLTIAANAYIFVNIGGGATATSSSATSVKVRRLGAETIDGTTNAIDTNIALYVVPGGTWTVQGSVTIANRNSSIANVRLAHVDGAIGAIATEDHILYDCPMLPYETKTILIPGMLAAQTLVVRSDTTNVNFKLHAEEQAAASGVYRLTAYDVVAADTDEAAYLAVAHYTNVLIYICNRNTGQAVTLNLACIDSNLIGDWADEDYELYQETITTSETKGYDLGVGLRNNETLGINSSATGVNVVIYGEEYV